MARRVVCVLLGRCGLGSAFSTSLPPRHVLTRRLLLLDFVLFWFCHVIGCRRVVHTLQLPGRQALPRHRGRHDR